MGGEADAHRRRVGVWVAFFSEVRPGLGSGWKWSQLEMCVCVYILCKDKHHIPQMPFCNVIALVFPLRGVVPKLGHCMLFRPSVDVHLVVLDFEIL